MHHLSAAAGGIEPCERQDNESGPAYEAFVRYRDQGRDRSVRRVAQESNKDPSLIGRWSSTHDWVRRVSAYDRHLDARRREAREDAILEMERRQATQLAAAAQALTQPVRAFLERIQRVRDEGEDPFASLSLSELQRMAIASVRHLPSIVAAERLVAGLSTQSVSPDASASVEEARRRAERMSRSEIEDYLLGVDDGSRKFLRGLVDAGDSA
jgi:hypothetical protein